MGRRHTSPPSMISTALLICDAALLDRKTTVPTVSSSYISCSKDLDYQYFCLVEHVDYVFNFFILSVAQVQTVNLESSFFFET